MVKEKPLVHSDADVSNLGLNESYRVVGSYETSSHVVHVPLDQKSTGRAYAKLFSLPGVVRANKNE